MDFKSLLAPYSENGRTPEGQVLWLTTRKGIPQDVADKAMLYVYDELVRGKVFASGRELDLYLLEVAQRMVQASAEEHASELGNFMAGIKKQWEDDLVALANASIGTGDKAKKALPWILAVQGLAAEAWMIVKYFVG